jgi:NRAMP (natural resistance-associated macrophage protein)-like metal ion transporter
MAQVKSARAKTKTSSLSAELKPALVKAKGFWHMMGPGLTTGAADDDPSGIATYSQAGARFGYQFLWLAIVTFPLMSMVQEMCARIGIASGRGLAANIRFHFPRSILIATTSLLFLANVFNLGADLGAMAQAIQLLLPTLPFSALVIGFCLLSLVLQIYIPYRRYATVLKWLALTLITYLLTTLVVDINWSQAARATLIPQIGFDRESILLMTAVLGTTISPYLFFWQTSQEVEEEILAGKSTLAKRQVTTSQDITAMRTDVWSGMFVSNLVMFCIIAVCGSALHAAGITDINTAKDAAEALRPLAGDAAYILFTLGIVGTGLLAIPVLAGSASYALAETFHFKEGLYRTFRQATGFYTTIIIAMLFGLAINFSGLDSIQALIYSAVANGVIAPIVLILIVLLANKKHVMGAWKNNWLHNTVGWLAVVLMSVASIATLVLLFS